MTFTNRRPSRGAVALAAAFGATLALAGLVLTASAAPGTVTVGPVADSYVQSDQPGTNFGTQTQIRADGSPVVRAYVRFDVQGLDGPVTKATARFYTNSAHTSGYSLYGVANTTWSETGITYGTAPALAASPVGSSGPFAAGEWTDVDVTPLVDGEGLVSLALTTTGSTAMSLRSREAGANAPQLVITTGGSAPDTAKPSVPTGLVAAASGASAIALDWNAATDDVGVAGYTVYRDGAEVGSTSGATQFTDTGLGAGTTHAYRVDAVDAAGNRSDRSAEATATTDSSGPAPDPGTFTPVADAHVRADQPASELGGLATLRVDPDPVTRAYLRFNPQGLSGTVTKATLRLFDATTHADGYKVSRVASTTWGEGTINYDNAPPIDGTSADSSGPLTAGSWSEVDVTPLVQGNGLVSFGLTAARAGNVNSMTFSSREGANAPQLVIDTGEPSSGDTTKPSVPTGLAASAAGPGAIALSWNAATDDVAVAGYGIYRDGSSVGTTSGAGTSFTDDGLAAGSMHAYRVDAVDTSGNRSARSAEVSATAGSGGGGGTDPVIAAAGDVACDPTASGFTINGGANECHMRVTSDLLASIDPDKILVLGDSQYENAAFSKYAGSFGPTWGRFKSLMRPAIGNHEYLTSGASGYFQYFGAAAGDPKKGYYSWDLGAWHLIALNSECSFITGGCGASGAQVAWLKADLAANTAKCTLAYWHEPRFSSGNHGDLTAVSPLWDALYAGGADVILNGHDHTYERFAPMSPAGTADSAKGIREFVVGTGGRTHYSIHTRRSTSQVANGDTFGVLKMTLHPTGYDWQFVPEPGKTLSDSGSTACH